MSKNITLVVTPEQEQAIGQLLSLLGVIDAPAKTTQVIEVETEECTATRKDGQPCQGTPLHGRNVCVAHARGTTKAQPRVRKAVAPKDTNRALSKKSRAEFAKAFVEQFGDVKDEQGNSIRHWSTKAIAEYVVTTKGVTAPSGFAIGKGYQTLFS